MRKHSGRATRSPASLFLSALGAVTLATVGACAPAFENAKTPSGQWCTDMPIYLNNQPEPDRAFHRLKPIATPIEPLTAPQRLEGLRREACKLGGDAVINAGDEETQTTDRIVIVRASGYAVRWTGGSVRSISSGPGAGGSSIGSGTGLVGTPAPPASAEPAPDGSGADTDGSGAAKAPAIAPRKRISK